MIAHAQRAALLDWFDYFDETKEIPDGMFEKVIKLSAYEKNTGTWSLEWWHLSNDEDGLDLLLGRFFDDYAQNYVNSGGRLVHSEMIDMALVTVETSVITLADRMVDEGVSEAEVNGLLRGARVEIEAILKKGKVVES